MKMLESFTKRDKESRMTIYYQLENMLVAGFKSEEELQRYQGLKASMRKKPWIIVSQLEKLSIN